MKPLDLSGAVLGGSDLEASLEDVGIDYSGIPSHCRDSLKAYVDHGQPVGDFLKAVLCNDLVGAFRRADGVNLLAIPDYAAWLHNEAPGTSWGNPALYKAWVERGGLLGKVT